MAYGLGKQGKNSNGPDRSNLPEGLEGCCALVELAEKTGEPIVDFLHYKTYPFGPTLTPTSQLARSEFAPPRKRTSIVVQLANLRGVCLRDADGIHSQITCSEGCSMGTGLLYLAVPPSDARRWAIK